MYIFLLFINKILCDQHFVVNNLIKIVLFLKILKR